MPATRGVLRAHSEAQEVGKLGNLRAEVPQPTRCPRRLDPDAALGEKRARRRREIPRQEQAHSPAALVSELDELVDVMERAAGQELLESPLGARRQQLPERLGDARR